MSQGYLLDTSVLSILAPGKPEVTPALESWLRTHADRLFISAVTVAEIEQGICKLRRTGGSSRADRLSQWLDTLIATAADRLRPLDSHVGRRAGAMSDHANAIGRHPGFADVAIAATADVHGLVVLTRNCKHFAPLGVAFLDPTETLPSE